MYALLLHANTGLFEDGLPVDAIGVGQQFLKAKSVDPDSPTYEQAITVPFREEFLEAMRNEIKELEDHQTWEVVNKTSVPADKKILASTWVFKTKRYPDGRARKQKARFCVRGDQQVEGVDYD